MVQYDPNTVTPLHDSSRDSARPSGRDEGYRVPPHNYEAEQALLGAIMANNRALEKVSDFLLAEHFADPTHGRIYEACRKLIENNQLANPITLKQYFERDDALSEVGGTQYLVRLAATVIGIINAGDYGRVVYDLHIRRQLIALGEEVVNDAFASDLDQPAVQQIEHAEHKLFTLATTGEQERGFQPFSTALTVALRTAEAAYKRDGKLTGLSSGFNDLDRLLGGLHKSDLVILAGRPSMGKTSLATNMAFYAAKRAMETANDEGGLVAFFSLEMSAEQLATRILSEDAEIPSEKIRRGDLGQDDFDRIVQTSQALSRSPLFIDDSAGLSIASLRLRARRLKRQNSDRLGLIVIDYLQLLSGSPGGRSDNRVQELSEITRGLKALAKELDVPVLALSQLSRKVEEREDKRPQLADLRESGSIEQDADVVMFVFREEYYLARQQPPEGTDQHAEWQAKMNRIYNLAEVIVAKQRHGPIGKVELQFDGRFTRFSNLVRDDHLPDERR